MSDTATTYAISHWFAVEGVRHHIRAAKDEDTGLWAVTHTEYPAEGAPEVKNTAASISDTEVAESIRTIMKLVGHIVIH